MKTTLQNSMRQAFSTLVILFLMILSLQAQDYLITFAGTGASTVVDSVIIENLMQGSITKMKGSEQLRLTVVTGIESMNENETGTLRFYPNPMIDQAKMQFILPETGETTITLYDISGRKISQRNDLLTRGRHVYVINGIEGGIYLAKVTSGRYSCSGRLISSGSPAGTPEIAYEHTLSLKEKPEGIKGTTVEKAMQYTTGDRLKIKGISGIYSTVLTIVPTGDKTVTFNFYACTDGSGNNYPIVIIGGGKGEYGEPDPENKAGAQIWMGENLKTTKLNTGVDLSYGDDEKWKEKPACCSYNNEERNVKSYGLLYNIYTIQSTKLCPVGWIIPPEAAYDILTDFLDGKDRAGGPLKETGTVFWGSTTGGTSNSTGFSGRPGGERTNNTYSAMGTQAQFWTANFYNGRAQYFVLYSFTDETQILSPFQWYQGYSVRCIMR